MSTFKLLRSALLAMLVTLAASGQALAQYSLEFLPTAVPGEGGFVAASALARGISGNGQVIVGSTNTLADERAVVWRRESGVWTRSLLPMLNGTPNRPAGRALAASYDGSAIVGWTGRLPNTSTTSNPGVPAMWRGTNTGAPVLETPFALDSGVRGVASGVSADGQSAALWTRSTTDGSVGPRLARLDGATVTYLTPEGPVGLGGVSAATVPSSSNMSSDGTVLAGMQSNGQGAVGVSFTQPGGLTQLPSVQNFYAKVGAVSGDGSVVGGTFGSQIIVNSMGSGALWRDGVRQNVVGASGLNVSVCLITGLSTNGGYGVGAVGNTLDPLNNFTQPLGSIQLVQAILLDWNTARDLRTLLTSNGVVISSTTLLHYANAITPDGRTIVGVGSRQIGTTNQREFVSFIATIPAPGGAAVIGVGMLMLASRRQR